MSQGRKNMLRPTVNYATHTKRWTFSGSGTSANGDGDRHSVQTQFERDSQNWTNWKALGQQMENARSTRNSGHNTRICETCGLRPTSGKYEIYKKHKDGISCPKFCPHDGANSREDTKECNNYKKKCDTMQYPEWRDWPLRQPDRRSSRRRRP